MHTLLLTAVLAFGATPGWVHSGWFADPPPVKKPAPAPPACSCRADNCPCDPCTCSPCVCVARPAPPAPPPAPTVHRWRLTDNSGQTWEFHDRDALILWVQARNFRSTPDPPMAASAPQTFQSGIPQFYSQSGPPQFGGFGGGCAGGQCGR